MKRRLPTMTLVALLGVLTMSGTMSLQAQEAPIPDAERTMEIHEAITERGIPVDTVRFDNGQIEVVLSPTCSAAQRLEAEAIRDELLSKPRPRIVVDNLTDALVVLRFEPDNASAQALVRARYDELKRQARSGQ
jgi:hypothetical protein